VSHPELIAVLRHFPLAPIERIEPLDMAGGWSGSQIWRVLAGRKPYCLRKWPAGQTAARLRLIHQILTHAAAEGIDFVPVPLSARSGEPLVPLAGHFWELAPWMPGRADYHEHPSPARLAAAMTALARFHVATASLASGRCQPPDDVAPPAIVERLNLVNQLLSGQFDRIAAAIRTGLSSDLDKRAATIVSLARHRLPPLREPLAAAAQLRLPLQPAIRDVHQDHVLFTGERVTGLVDFGALRIDTPLADVARIVGSLVGDDSAGRQLALDAYSTVRPLSAGDRRLIDLLDIANTVLSGLNWLQWLYVDRRDMGPPEPIVRRLEEILTRLVLPETG
jgi:homoserine kinase type II